MFAGLVCSSECLQRIAGLSNKKCICYGPVRRSNVHWPCHWIFTDHTIKGLVL